jgi:alpha-tubulin suppressor-like RCC1 family protein
VDRVGRPRFVIAAALAVVLVLAVPASGAGRAAVRRGVRVVRAVTTRVVASRYLRSSLTTPKLQRATPVIRVLANLAGTMSVNNNAAFTPTTTVTIDSSVPCATRIRIGADAPWKSVAVGGHAVAVRSDGTLWSWGTASNGRLGTGSVVNTNTPVRIGAASDWSTVTVSPDASSYALKTDGSLWGWGWNGYYELGDGTNTMRTTPVPLFAGETWRWAGMGSRYGAGLRSDGTLWTWGNNAEGQLGCGDNALHAAKVQVAPGTTWRAAAAGSNHMVALRSDGTLWAWGDNTKGELGQNTTTSANVPVQIGTGNTWTQVAAGALSTYALRADGTLWACGYGWLGQLGNNTPYVDGSKVLVQVNGGAVYRSLFAGNYRVAAIRTDGTLVEWGAQWNGEIGDGTNTNIRAVPTAVAGGATDWTYVALGFTNSAGLRGYAGLSDLYSWGNNGNGTVGDGTNTERWLPTLVYPGSYWQAYASSKPATLSPALPDGLKTATAWYRDDVGNTSTLSDTILLGNAEFALNHGAAYATSTAMSLDSTTSQAQDIKVLPPYQQVFTSMSHAAGLTSGGDLWFWGGDYAGCFGDGRVDAAANPGPRRGPAGPWKSVGVGFDFSVGVKADGSLWTWGLNDRSQLGTSTAAVGSTAVPVRVGTASNWSTVTAGYRHVIALDNTGKAYSFGDNTYYQCGYASPSMQPTPTAVSGTDTYTQVVAGYDFSMGLTPDGRVMQWGPTSGTPTTAP